MDRILEKETAEELLPPLRDDLEIVRGAPLSNGAPSWVIYDRVSDKYYEIGREILDQLSFWSVGSIDKLAELLFDELGREVSAQEIKETIHFLISNSLVRDIPGNDYKVIVNHHQNSKKSLLSKVAHGYLFFRIPLFRPDKFLRATWPWIRGLFSKSAIAVLLMIAIAGLFLTSRQWEHFTGTFQYMLSVNGLMLYGFSLIIVKSIHELGHAYMATKYGLRVPTIGVAFIVLMPILYTDTSAAWRLPSRRKRLMIDGAGIFSELALASIATLLWVFLPDGGVRLVVFGVATTSWVSSLIINLNPLMRFDGYYILSDALGFQNMQGRGFAMAQWQLRDLLFRTGEPQPERLSVGMRRFVVLHAWATWIYRFFLFLGIALLVYTFFVKVIGILLFVLEICWFIILPIIRELKRWWAMRSMIVKSKRSLITLGVIGVVVMAVLTPLSTQISIPSFLTAEREIRVYPPYSAKLVKANVQEGVRVEKGDVLFQFESPKLEKNAINVRQRSALLRARLDRIGSDERDRTARIVLLNELEVTRKEQRGIERLLEDLIVKAQFDGTVVDLDPEVMPGMWIGVDQSLALLHGIQRVSIKGYVSEGNLFRFGEGADAEFIPEDPALKRINLSVKRISYAGVKYLNEPYLALRYGGAIATSNYESKNLTPTNAYYAVLLEPAVGELFWNLNKVVRGVTVIRGAPQSLYERTKRSVLSILVREMGI